MDTASYILLFTAGALTSLSPCVLPILPFVTGSSLSRSSKGPLALALGLLLTFVASTLIISQAGSLFGVSPSNIRLASGVILAASGLLFIWDDLQNKFSQFLSRIISRFSSGPSTQPSSLLSEFIGGMILGVVWTPCSGPSLGAALGIASQASNLGAATSSLLLFGLGAVLPLLIIAYGGRAVLQKIKNQSRWIGVIKKTLGVIIFVFGILIATNWDRKLEASVTNLLPDSWIQFVTDF